MKIHFIIGAAAIAFSTAFASAPAFAYYVGRGVNDGGPADAQAAPAPKAVYNSVAPAAPATPHYGRGLNDGGMVDQPGTAQMATAKNVKWIQYPPHVGRNLNDGGF